MNDSPTIPVQHAVPPSASSAGSRFWVFAGAVALLALLMMRPLAGWMKYAFKNDDASHTILIPFIVGWLVWQVRGSLPAATTSWRAAIVPALLAVAMLFLPSRWLELAGGADAVRHTTNMLAFALGVLAVALACFGTRVLWELRFSAAFLLLIAPLPPVVVSGFETVLQHASAVAARLFLMPFTFLRSPVGFEVGGDGLLLELPNITLKVAQECSGVRSTLVLIILSLVAAQQMLQRPSHRLWLVLATIPLGVLRNGFRILVIGLLCQWISPEMEKSIIHTQGGPLFFVLSLIPFFWFLFWLRRREDSVQRGK